MEEIFKMANLIGQKGVILIITSLTLSILLLLSAYFLSFSLTESKISKSQETSTKSYHLAEAGISQAIWKLKYDETEADGDAPWADCFVTSTASCSSCSDWSETFTKSTDELLPESSVTVTIQNSSCGRGRITATSTLNLSGGKTAQRVVKTSVFKSLVGPTGGAAVFSGGTSENIYISGSKLKVYGNIFSNNNLTLKWWSEIEVYDSVLTPEVEGKILAVANLDISLTSEASSTAKCAKNICDTTSTCACIEEADKFQECEADKCRPNSASTPLVDFDSDSQNSFKSRAQAAEDAGQCEILCNGVICLCDGSPCPGADKCVLDDDEFEDLLWAAGENGTLSLNNASNPGIVYVTGPIELRGGRHLVVNGALVADGTIDIGERYSWTKQGQKDSGFSQIDVYRPTATTSSGILTQAKMNFGLYSSFSSTEITGVIYANDEIRFVSLPENFEVTGGLIARKLSFNSVWNWFNFILDDEIVLYGLGYKIDETVITPEYSPIITIEHWEEAY